VAVVDFGAVDLELLPQATSTNANAATSAAER
jgi:hypothetical protein